MKELNARQLVERLDKSSCKAAAHHIKAAILYMALGVDEYDEDIWTGLCKAVDELEKV